MGPNSVKYFKIFSVLIVIVILTMTAVFLSVIYPNFARNQVIEAMLFKNGTESMTRFETTNDLKNLRLSFYLYNITNPDDVRFKGAKFNLTEIGPFVYSEYKYRKFLNNNQTSGLITYKLFRQFTFDPVRSCRGCDPKRLNITWLNIPLLSVANYVGNISGLPMVLLNSYIDRLDEKFTMTATAEEFIFSGSERPFFKSINELMKLIEKRFNITIPNPLPDNKFALLYSRNNNWSHRFDRVLTVSAGFGANQTYHDLNQYVAFDGLSNMSIWNDKPEQCNKVRGTDGEFFSPFLNKIDKVEVFPLDVCRHFTMKYKEDTSIYGVPASHYILDEKTLQSGLKNPENSCYCLKGEKKSYECSVDGLVDLRNCNNQINIYASGAHFWAGSKELLEKVDGISKPDHTLHEPMFLIETNTGLALKAFFPIQFNVKVFKNNLDIFRPLKNIEPLFLPFAWVTEESEMTEEQSKMLKTKLLLLDTWLVSTVFGGSVILFMAIIVAGVILFLRYRGRADHSDQDSLVTNEQPQEGELEE